MSPARHPRRRSEAAPADGGGGRPRGLSQEDDLLLREVAAKVVRRGLATPAVLWLESLRPVSFLGSQAMHFLDPFVQVLGGGAAFGRLAALLEERSNLERLLQHIEDLERGRDAPPRKDGA